MRHTLDEFAPQPYTDRAVRHVLDSRHRHRRWTVVQLRRHLPREGKPPAGVVHLVLARAAVLGLFDVHEDGTIRFPSTAATSTPVRGVPVSGAVVPLERRHRESPRTYWNLYVDGSWWVLNPGHEHPGPAYRAQAAARVWASRNGRTAELVVPDADPDAPWLVRFRPRDRS